MTPAIQNDEYFGGVEEMSLDEWHQIPDNPRQRDTKYRAKGAKHLHVLHPVHSRVEMAILPDGRRFKIDGHTRDYVWHNDLSNRMPDKVLVDVWHLPDMVAVERWYQTRDSRNASKTAKDDMYGSSSALGYVYQSEVFRMHRFSNALRVATQLIYGEVFSQRDMAELLRNWHDEIFMLDAIGITKNKFISPVLTGAFILLRRYGDEALPFLREYQNGSGSQIDGIKSPSIAFTERLTNLKLQRATTGRANAVVIASLLASAYERERDGKDYAPGTGSSVRAFKANRMEKYLKATAKRVPWQ